MRQVMRHRVQRLPFVAVIHAAARTAATVAKEIIHVGRVELAGVVQPLATKAREIAGACGSIVNGGVRSHSFYVAGTRRMSLHKIGRAVDARGNPSCIYAHLKGWPGGVSTDYARVHHVHFSYDPQGREWGLRFAHGHWPRAMRLGRRHRMAS